MASELIYEADAHKAILKENASIAYCIDNIKPVDAVEVVHGRWELYPSDRSIRCTNCKMEFSLIHMPYTRNYCPNCGAKMRGNEE